MKEILKKLSEIQATISVAKNQKNSFGNYNYRSCEDILQALQPYCEKLGVVILLSDEIKETSNGWVYVEATARIIDTETEKDIFVKAQAGIQERKGMDLSQTFGASSSYARKYALNGLLKLDDNKDADTDAFTKKVKEIEKNDKSKTSENKDFKIEEKEIITKEEKTPKKAQEIVNDSDLPFDLEMDDKNIKEEKANMQILERLRDTIVSKLYQLGYDDLPKAMSYYAKKFNKETFEDLKSDELATIIDKLDATIKQRKEA